MSRCGPRSGGRGIFHRRPFRNTRIWNRIFLNHRRTKQTVEIFWENYEERKRVGLSKFKFNTINFNKRYHNALKYH